MWDLTVSDVHTFAVGEGQWVVHNAGPCGGADFVVTPDGIAVPTDVQALKAGLSNLTDVSTGGYAKYTGEAGGLPVRYQFHEGHVVDPTFTGTPNPLHIVDHLHIDRQFNGMTGPWEHQWTIGYPWPF